MESKQKLIKKIMKPLRFIWIGLFIFLFLFVCFYFALKIPSVQNYIGNKTTEILSDRLETKVTLGDVDINLFKGFKLEELYIEDHSQDTLLYVESIYSDFYNSLKSFYRKSFYVNDLALENGKIFIKRTAEDPVYNYLRLLNKDYDPFQVDTTLVDKDVKPKKTKAFDLSLNSLKLENIEFRNLDEALGSEQKAFLKSMKAKFDTFNIQTLNFAVSDIDLDGIDLFINKFTPEKEILFPDNDKEEVAFQLRVSQLNTKNAKVNILDSSNNISTPYLSSEFNPSDIRIKDLEFNVKDVFMTEPYYTLGEIDNMSMRIGDLKVRDFEADKFFLEKRKAGLENFSLRTDNSSIKENLSFSFRKMSDWKEFVDRVIINGNMVSTKIAIQDLFFFAPKLKENNFFMENANENILLDGKFSGRINSFNARDFKAEITNNLKFDGSIIARDITDPDETLINVGINKLNTDLTTLKKIIPGFQVPPNFYKLNTLNFKGRFDGYYQDFVAYGDMITDLGRVDVDMRLNLKEGSKNASYSGKLNLYDFNLKTWAGNDKFGNLSFSANVENGSGLELNTAYAELGGELISFDYNGYKYNGLIDAKLEQNLFDGKFSSEDENVNFDFEGSIDLKGNTPVYDFKANVDSINLVNLNLSKDIDYISGIVDIKAKGSTIDDIVGSALGNKIIIRKGNDTLDFGHLALASTVEANGIRSLFMDSDIGAGEIIGTYKLTELPDAVIAIIKNNYPDFTENIKYISGVPKENVDVDFDLNVISARDLISFLLPDKVAFDSLVADGNMNLDENVFNINIVSPFIQYEENIVQQIDAEFKLDDRFGLLNFESSNVKISNSEIKDIIAAGKLTNDSIHFEIFADNALDSIENIDLAGEIFPAENEVEFKFSSFNFDLLKSNWKLTEDNSVITGSNKLKLRNFNLYDDDRRISLRSINDNKGLEATVEDVPLAIINEFIPNEDVRLNGDTDATVSFTNIFEKSGLFLNAKIEDFEFSEKILGDLNIDATTDFDTKKINYKINLDDNEDIINLNGNYGIQSELINAQLDVSKFPLDILEVFLDGSIENTQGLVSAQIDIDGRLNNLNTRGIGEINNGYTEIVYLGTKYSFEDAIFEVKKNFVDFTGAKLVDTRSQVATIKGGLTHENFQQLGLDARIESEKFILLDTDAEDNSSYYGFGQGKANVGFLGKFTELVINVNATTDKETIMTLPITYSNSTRDESFLPIVTREEFVNEIEAVEEKDKIENYYVGLTVNMNLTVTEEAEMIVLFDPNTGHQLKGHGAGDLQLLLSPNGDIDMFGTYNIESGVYDFALENFIKKEFTIQQGGYISWTGPPLDANINIAADYRTIRTSLDVFLAEYLGGNTELQTSASQETDVLLTVNLTDQLLNPTIKFDIEFPNIAADLASLVNNKLEILKEDPANLTGQVIGLLIFNNFLPYNNPIATISNSAVNSSFGVIVGELLSAQLSNYVSSLMETILDENGLIYDVEVDVRVENATNALLPTANATGYGVTFKPKFNNDRIDVVLGGDYLTATGNSSVPFNYTTGDFILDYYLNEERKIKIRIYGRSDIQVLGDGRRQRVGAGFYFRREFSELNLNSLRKSSEKFVEEIKEDN